VKNRPGWWVSVSTAALLGCLSAGCASGNPSRGGGYYLDDGPGKPDPERVARLMREPDPVPKHEPLLARANRPYRVMGQDFAPMTERKPYKKQGVASWYGQRFHGKPTSTGETYDMYQMTAAHPTLPLPSYARVTRLDNGRSVVVRVNDRGPFLRGRLIDLSYLAASKLGYVGKGHAEVEVELLNPADAGKGRTLTAQPAVKAAPSQARTLPAVSLARAELDLPGDEGAPADKELASAEAPRADERARMAGSNNGDAGASVLAADNGSQGGDAFPTAEAMTSESRRAAPGGQGADLTPNRPSARTQAASMVASTHAAAPAPVRARRAAEGDSGWFLQLGVFRQLDNALRVQREQMARSTPSDPPVELVQRGDQYRVLLGPYADEADARAVAADIGQRTGHKPGVSRQ
jgi:rare lipoprotein A